MRCRFNSAVEEELGSLETQQFPSMRDFVQRSLLNNPDMVNADGLKMEEVDNILRDSLNLYTYVTQTQYHMKRTTSCATVSTCTRT
jgi:hypothetical protein